MENKNQVNAQTQVKKLKELLKINDNERKPGTMIVKRFLDDGTLVIDEYDTKKYYDNYKEKRGYSKCDHCGSTVLTFYLSKHKTTNKCKNYDASKIKNL